MTISRCKNWTPCVLLCLWHVPQLGKDTFRKALLARCHLTGHSVSFGQFLSQILCCGIPKSDLQRAADMAMADKAPAAPACAPCAPDVWQVAFIGMAALGNLEQDLDVDKNVCSF